MQPPAEKEEQSPVNRHLTESLLLWIWFGTETTLLKRPFTFFFPVTLSDSLDECSRPFSDFLTLLESLFQLVQSRRWVSDLPHKSQIFFLHFL